jgi:acyl-coenzyme A thioesterase PaaI-like protein
MFKIPEHGYCFVCGSSSKKGLNATLFLMDDRSVCCEYEFDINFQGPPGFVHGAASFSLLDEVIRARGLYILVENELLGNVKKVFIDI